MLWFRPRPSPHLPCLRAWPGLAARSGRDPALRPEPLRRDGSVLAFGDVVLKHVPDGFGRVLRAHRQAARALRDDPLNRAVPLLGFDAEHKVLMLGRGEGVLLAERAAQHDEMALLCKSVGRWLRAFHDARPITVGPFDAEGPLRRVPAQAAFLPETYAAARAILGRRAAAVQGTPQVHAVLHGDLHATNLLMSGDVLTGLDFGNLRPHPALRDAGQILAALHLRAAEPPLRVLPADWRAGFEMSYGPCGPLLEVFTLQRLLLHWAQVPARLAGLGPSRRRMARALATIFERIQEA